MLPPHMTSCLFQSIMSDCYTLSKMQSRIICFFMWIAHIFDYLVLDIKYKVKKEKKDVLFHLLAGLYMYYKDALFHLLAGLYMEWFKKGISPTYTSASACQSTFLYFMGSLTNQILKINDGGMILEICATLSHISFNERICWLCLLLKSLLLKQ